ncbi:iron-sulfur cluster biosynthesis family protein [Metabacillus sp. SLBN-84]
MKMTVTDSAKEQLKSIPEDKMLQLSLDRGSCDIVNTLYEMRVVPKRNPDEYEKILEAEKLSILVDHDFEEAYDHELTIDYSNNFFVFKNKNQTFNNRIGLRYV